MCGSRFTAWQYSQKFCSIKCQQKDYDYRNRDYRRAGRRERQKTRGKVYDRTKQLKRYGLTLDDYNDMVEAQGGKCAICGIAPEYLLRVDHDHATGAVRQLLCIKCNLALGYVNDNPELALRVSDYLVQWGAGLRPE